MNRAVMLRMAACGIMGLGAALLIAAQARIPSTAGRKLRVPPTACCSTMLNSLPATPDPANGARPFYRPGDIKRDLK